MHPRPGIKSMNVKPGEFAFVIRPIPQVPVGTIVKVNSWAVIGGVGRWDVEASGGLFFYPSDDDLCALRGWDIPAGFRDELFDPVWIFGDFPEGQIDIKKLGQPKRWRRA
jgi:hypothetical protein